MPQICTVASLSLGSQVRPPRFRLCRQGHSPNEYPYIPRSPGPRPDFPRAGAATPCLSTGGQATFRGSRQHPPGLPLHHPCPSADMEPLAPRPDIPCGKSTSPHGGAALHPGAPGQGLQDVRPAVPSGRGGLPHVRAPLSPLSASARNALSLAREVESRASDRPPRPVTHPARAGVAPSLRPHARIGIASQRPVWLSESGVPCAPQGDLFGGRGQSHAPIGLAGSDGRHPPPVPAVLAPAGAPWRGGQRPEPPRPSLAVGCALGGAVRVPAAALALRGGGYDRKSIESCRGVA
jgi:hypothetical protein